MAVPFPLPGAVTVTLLNAALHHVSSLRSVVVTLWSVPRHQPVWVAHAESVRRIQCHLNKISPCRHVTAVAGADGRLQRF